MKEQSYNDWLDGINEPTEHEKRWVMFERSAASKGYDTAKDGHGRYKDDLLQEAWSIFAGIPKIHLKDL